MSNERWKTCVGFADYDVSSTGRVRRATPSPYTTVGRMLKPRAMKNGYICVYIKNAPRLIHRLVAETFIGGLGEGHAREVHHLNGVKADNRLENLEITTQSANAKHSYRIGTSKPNTGPRPSMQGSGHPRAIFNETQVIEIRRRVAAGEKQTLLAKEFGVAPQALNKVVKGHSFKHLQPKGEHK